MHVVFCDCVTAVAMVARSNLNLLLCRATAIGLPGSIFNMTTADWWDVPLMVEWAQDNHQLSANNITHQLNSIWWDTSSVSSFFNNQWIGSGYHSNCSDARAKHDMHICGYYINILMHEQIVFVLISTSEGCSATVWGSKTQIKLYSSSHKHSRKCGTTGSIETVRTGYQSKRGLSGFSADARTAPGHQNDSSRFFIGL